MKLKYVNDNITIKELSENCWNGCKYSTLKFINDAILNEEYEASKGFNDEYYEVYIGDEEYLVNVKLFEVIEEPKKIEKLDYKYNSQVNKLELAKKINEIIDKLNEVDSNE